MTFIFGGGLISAIVFALLSYFIADRNGMNRVGWTLLGFFLNVIGFIITFLVAFSKTKNKV